MTQKEMTLNEIEDEYWRCEMHLAQYADSKGMTKQDLIKNIGRFDVEYRLSIQDILRCQRGLLEMGNRYSRRELLNNTVVSLSEYRNLRRRNEA